MSIKIKPSVETVLIQMTCGCCGEQFEIEELRTEFLNHFAGKEPGLREVDIKTLGSGCCSECRKGDCTHD